MSPALRLFLSFVIALILTIVHVFLAPDLLVGSAGFEGMGLVVLVNFFGFLVVYFILVYWLFGFWRKTSR